MVDPPLLGFFLVLGSGSAGHAFASRSRVALHHGEDRKAAVRRSGGQRYQSKQNLLPSNRVITLFPPQPNAGEWRQQGSAGFGKKEAASPLAVAVGACVRQAPCVNFMYTLTQYAARGGGENVALSSVSFAHAPSLVAGCNRTSFTAPSLSSFMSIQKLSRSFPARCAHCFIVLRCFSMNSLPNFSSYVLPSRVFRFASTAVRASCSLVAWSSARVAATSNATAITTKEILMSNLTGETAESDAVPLAPLHGNLRCLSDRPMNMSPSRSSGVPRIGAASLIEAWGKSGPVARRPSRRHDRGVYPVLPDFENGLAGERNLRAWGARR